MSQVFAKPTIISVAELNDILNVNTSATRNSILLFTLLSAIAYYAYYYSPILYSRGKFLRNIPWKEGVPIFSYRDFHRDSDTFVFEGFRRFGKTFAFRFMKVSVNMT